MVWILSSSIHALSTTGLVMQLVTLMIGCVCWDVQAFQSCNQPSIINNLEDAGKLKIDVVES